MWKYNAIWVYLHLYEHLASERSRNYYVLLYVNMYLLMTWRPQLCSKIDEWTNSLNFFLFKVQNVNVNIKKLTTSDFLRIFYFYQLVYTVIMLTVNGLTLIKGALKYLLTMNDLGVYRHFHIEVYIYSHIIFLP